MLYWLLKYVLLGPILRLFWPTKVVGMDNIPASGGAIVASNHLAVVDSFFLSTHVRRRIVFLAKSEYFTGGGVKGKLQKWFFSGSGQYPIDRSGGSAGRAALDTGVRLLSEGRLLGVYPEGTRSPDGKLYKGKTGVGRMALEANVRIVPVAMIGTDRVNPIGSKMWWPMRIEIRIGEPLDFSRYAGLAGDRFVERSIADELMYALMELSGQEYADMYAAKAKELADAERRGVAVAVPKQEAVPDADRVVQSRAS
ncbi:MAG: lysophospholipid acyltransferase family protein [Haloechinothrix sp.]